MDATTAFALVIGLMLLGRGLVAARVVTESAPDALNAVVLYVCLPASVLLYAPTLSIDLNLLRIAAVPWVLMGFGAALVWIVARRRRWPEAVTAVVLLAVTLGNTSFLGYPLVAALLGEQALPVAVVYDQFGSFLMLSTVGLFVIAHYAHGRPPGPREMAWRVLRFPPFVALMVALLLMPDQYPPMVELALRRLADALLPLVCLALGMQLRLVLPRAHVAPLTLALTTKLLLLPLAAWILCTLLGVPATARPVVVLESAMPTMMTAMALTASARLAPELGAAVIGYGVVLAIVLLPAWSLLLR